MDRRERILAMGNLIKSPVKNKDKATFSKFWKLRWFVLAEVLFVDADEFVEDSKLVFSYYKDRESHAKDEQPKGTLNISQCKSIKSCFQPQANFDHLFIMEFNDGKIVRFSAPSCEKKFKWVSLLYKYRFNGNIENIMKAFGMQGTSSNQQSNTQNRASVCSNGRSSSFKKRYSGYRNGRDSGMFSPIDTLSLDGQCGDPPPLPPRRQSTLSGISNMSDDFDAASPSTKVAINPNEIDLNMLQVFNDLFILCSKCKTEAKRKSSFTMNKRSSKKWENKEEDVELRRESVGRGLSSPNDGDNISQFSNTSDDFFMEDPFDPYTKIDDILLEKVKEIQQVAEKAKHEITEVDEKSKVVENDLKVTKETENLIEQATIQEQALKHEEEEYMDMSQFKKEPPVQPLTESTSTLPSGSQVTAESEGSDASQEEAITDQGNCEGGLQSTENQYEENMKQVFQMDF